MSRELEDPEDSNQSYHAQYSQTHSLVGRLVLWRNGSARQVQRVFLLSHDGGQGDEVGNDRNYIDYIHNVPEEIELIRTRQEPHNQFKRKPDYTERFYQEEGVGDVRNLVLFDLGGVGGSVEHLVMLELRQGFKAEDDDGKKDDEHADNGNDASGLGALGILKQQPDFALALV